MKQNKLHVKVGDTVMIISGRDSKTGELKDPKNKDSEARYGKTGKVLAVSTKEGKIIVEGCNIVKKHVKPKKMGEAGGILEAESAIYACKVMHVDPKTGKPVRVAHKTDDNGKKIRYTVGRNASGADL